VLVEVPALAELIGRVAAAKQVDALAPVTVVVPSAIARLTVRRALAARLRGDDHQGGTPPPRSTAPAVGVVHLQCLTLGGLANLLGSAALAAADRPPAGRLAERLATERAVGRLGGSWTAVAQHPATIDAVIAACREINDLDDAQRRHLASRGPVPAALVAMASDVRAQLAPAYDTAELVAVAAASVRADAERWRQVLGTVIVHLPDALAPGEATLLRAVAAVAPTSVLLGTTGDAEVDDAALAPWRTGAVLGTVVTACHASGGGLAGPARAPAGPAAAGAPPAGAPMCLPPAGPRPALPRRTVERLSAPAADAEVLAAVRWLVRHWEAGAAPTDLALAHPPASPYPGLVRAALERVGIPFHASGDRPLAATVTGRALLGALDLPGRGWRRDDVVDWLASGPLLDGGRPVPAERWDRVSRQAGVTGGLTQWADRLAAWADRHDPPDGEAVGLARFVAGLAERFRVTPTTWAGWAAWAQRLLADVLGGPRQRDRWPDATERQAFDEVAELLTELGQLPDDEGPVDLATVRRTVASMLRSTAPTITRIGSGVLVGAPEQVVDADRPVVAVVGLAEGWLPGPSGDDPIIGEDIRRGAGLGMGPGRRRALRRRQALAALGLQADHLLLATSRADPGAGRPQEPAEGWLAAPGASEPRAPATVVELVEEVGAPIDLADHRLRSLLRWRRQQRSLRGHPALDLPEVAARLPAGARSADRLGAVDGWIGADLAARLQPGGPVAPTVLERYATCPRAAFFHSLLRVDELPKPEAIQRISPMERGNLVHRVLARFLGPVVASPSGAPPPDVPWGDDHRRRMQELFEEAADAAERAGLTGLPALWAVDRRQIARDLQLFLEHDSARRAATRATPVAVEWSFGDPASPVAVDIAHGRSVTFRGAIDRVDESPEGIIVYDYKTGRHGARRRSDGDPVAAGTQLQLPVYALAAERLGVRQRPGRPTRSAYWNVTTAGGFDCQELDVDDEVRARLGTVVGVLVDALAVGAVPGRPGPVRNGTWEHCAHCPYDRICPADREAGWQAARADPRLSALVALVDGDQPTSEDGGDPGADR